MKLNLIAHPIKKKCISIDTTIELNTTIIIISKDCENHNEIDTVPQLEAPTATTIYLQYTQQKTTTKLLSLAVTSE